MIVGFAAGGGNDLFARLIGQKLSENMGQPVVIENRPGAGGRLAVEYAMVQGADGYTLVVGATGQMAIASAIYPKLPYHPTRTFAPIANGIGQNHNTERSGICPGLRNRPGCSRLSCSRARQAAIKAL